jgi:hypothetical protein
MEKEKGESKRFGGSLFAALFAIFVHASVLAFCFAILPLPIVHATAPEVKKTTTPRAAARAILTPPVVLYVHATPPTRKKITRPNTLNMTFSRNFIVLHLQPF